MLAHTAIFLAGFTVVTAPILVIAYLFFLPDMRKSTSSKAACTLMLAVLLALQLWHYGYFTAGAEPLASSTYLFLLMVSPPVFYLFSRSVLFTESRISLRQFLHFGWLLLLLVLTNEQLAISAFVIGTGYTIWFARVIWGLRAHRAHFHLEMFFFVLFAMMAVGALLFGLALPYVGPDSFYMVYSTSIGIAMALVMAAIIVFPELLSDILRVSDLTYAKSKLDGVDVAAIRSRLDALMDGERVYQNEELNLNSLADMVKLTPHQLSELINTHYEMGFPRYLREIRIKAAKELLLREPDSSILAISMMAGFKSQSNFYTAFKESTGLSPGNFRQQGTANSSQDS